MDFCTMCNDPFYKLINLCKCCISSLKGLSSKLTFSLSAVPEENNVSA